MAYFEKSDGEEFERGDKVVVVNCGNPDLEVAPGQTIISASEAANRGITARGQPIEDVVTEGGDLHERFRP